MLRPMLARQTLVGSMIILGGGLVALATLAVAPAQDAKKEPAVTEEFKRLEGKWHLVALERNGRVAGAQEVGTDKFLLLSGNNFIVAWDKTVHAQATFSINPTQAPRWLDVTRTADGVMTPGIYELKGDTLRMCQGEPKGKRPAELKTEKGARQSLFTYQRVNQ